MLCKRLIHIVNSVVFLVLLQKFPHLFSLANRMAKRTQLLLLYAQQYCFHMYNHKIPILNMLQIFYPVLSASALNPLFHHRTILCDLPGTRLTGHVPYRDLVGGWIAVEGVASESCIWLKESDFFIVDNYFSLRAPCFIRRGAQAAPVNDHWRPYTVFASA